MCGKTFSERRGTMFFGRRTAAETITLVVTLVAHGCPVQAIEAAFGVQARTVERWAEAAGKHCEQVHQATVLQPGDLGQVQADEIRAKMEGTIVWLAMAVMVPARQWLGGVLSASRDTTLIRRLVALIRAGALPRPLLLVSDGLVTYLKCFLQTFRQPQRTGQPGRPKLRVWPTLWIGQVIKHYRQRRVVAVVHRLVHGAATTLEGMLQRTQGGGVLNTAYIERLNATFRARLVALVRRTRALLRRQPLLHAVMYLVGTVYNFCTFHASLTHDGVRRTPAMVAGITAHCWSVAELLWHRVPPPPWRPPKRRGRPSQAMQRLVAQWTG